jgi:hypothetical protein
VRSIAFVLSVCVCEVGPALERTGFARTYRIRSNACVQKCVCEIGRCARTNAGEFERIPVSTFERTGYVRIIECIV